MSGISFSKETSVFRSNSDPYWKFNFRISENFFQFVGMHKKSPDDFVIGGEMCWLMEHRITSCKRRVAESCQNRIALLNRVFIYKHSIPLAYSNFTKTYYIF